VNPTANRNAPGLRAYDHADYINLPAYAVARDGIGELLRALMATNAEMAVDDFHQMLVDLAAGRQIADGCPHCPGTFNVPYRVDIDTDGDGAQGHYRCARGHEWTCGWGLNALHMLRGLAA
jgi:hypothetical protein